MIMLTKFSTSFSHHEYSPKTTKESLIKQKKMVSFPLLHNKKEKRKALIMSMRAACVSLVIY